MHEILFLSELNKMFTKLATSGSTTAQKPAHLDQTDLRVAVGGPDCKQPYSASLLNISAMSYGSLSANAVLALNSGAKMGNFAHNTGEGGISKFHHQVVVI